MDLKSDMRKIPSKGNNGTKGTLKGLGLLGSVFLKIRTATHTIIKDVNVPKLHNSAAVEISSTNIPHIQIIPTRTVKTCGVLNFG